MICEIHSFGNFFLTWILMIIVALISNIILSGYIFVKYYVNVTYEKWLYKSNPEFPSPQKVKL